MNNATSKALPPRGSVIWFADAAGNGWAKYSVSHRILDDAAALRAAGHRVYSISHRNEFTDEVVTWGADPRAALRG